MNHTTGDRCHLKFAPYSYFSRDVARKVRKMQRPSTDSVLLSLHTFLKKKKKNRFTFTCISCAINVIYEVIKHKLPPGFLERSTLFYLYFYCVFSVFVVFSFTVTLCLETTCFCFMDHDDLPPPIYAVSANLLSLSLSCFLSLSLSPFLR